MTDILCKWLNDELNISQTVEPATFARDFSSGYLIGEVLQKYQLQDDFDQFSQSRTADSKLNNFTRLEPVFQLLGIPFNVNVARDVMTEKHGIAMRLLYHIYVALNKRKGVTSLSLEAQRPGAQSMFSANESTYFKERLQNITPRQVDRSIADVSSRFKEQHAQRSFRERFLESERRILEQQQLQQENLERTRLLQAKQSEMVAKIKSAAMPVPKPPSRSNKALQERKAQRRKREASDTVEAISRFEDKLKMILLPTDDGSDDIDISYILKRDEERADTLNVVKMSSNSEYIGKIRKRLQEDAAAREEREKRRRKVIGEQLSAHQAQEEARREEMMVNKLMRQSQQERRVAVQLLQARQEKAVIRKNRIAKEQQFQQRRLKEFDDALDMEAEMARLRKEEYKDQIQMDKELHDKIAAQRAEERYRRHYDSCYDIIAQVVDFSCKVAEYRQYTENLIPAKLMRDWTAMFISGSPLYETAIVASGDPTPEQILEEERQLLLDEGDFMEYKTMMGEWQPPESTDVGGPPRSNPVVGHIIQRLYNIVHPPTPPPPPPEFPPFPIRACVLGKAFSGKTTVLNQLVEAGQDVDSPAADVAATAADGSGADLEAVTEEGSEKPPASEKSSANQARRLESKEKPGSMQRSRDRNRDPNEPLPSVRNKLGGKALKFIKKGRPVDDQIVVDILAEAIKQVPENTGWVIDGYPQNCNQAKLLEKALSGYDATAKENLKQAVKSKSRKSSLVPDPRPTPPPSEPTSGIDVVILFDIEDEVCMKRAAGRSKSIEGGEEYHEELNPPPEGSATGVGKQEKVLSVSDSSNEQDQLQHRLNSFIDAWPKLDKWFTRFGTLKKVSAADQQNAVFLEVEKILEDTVAKNLGKDLESSLPMEQIEGTEKAEETPEGAAVAPPEAGQEQAAPDTKPPSRPPSKTGSRTGSGKRPGSRASSGKKDSQSPKRDGSPGKRSEGRKSSAGSTAKSVKGAQKESASKDLSQEQDLEVEEPAEPKAPEPGDEEWDFVDLDLDTTLADILSTQWDGVEKTYIANCKHVFRQIRQQRESIYRYFFQIRKDFLAYLRRPDNKQDYVSLWQKDYNSVPNDLREDDEMRAELHQRVDDLREQLWNICDQRKDQAEQERESVINDGWLDDRLGILSNDYITVMQAELDRFQDTVRLLKDYYKGMDGQIPEELNSSYERVPLVELPVDKEALVNTSDSDNLQMLQNNEMSAAKSDGSRKSDKDSARSPKEDRKKLIGPVGIDRPEPKIKIPMVKRYKGFFDDSKSGKGSAARSRRDGKSDSPFLPSDPDERLLFEAHHYAANGIAQIMGDEMASKQAEEEREEAIRQEKENEKAKLAKKGKKGKKAKEAPPVVEEELSEEEKLKKETKERLRYEYYFTIKEEELAARTRLELIRAISIAVVQDLKYKADNAFKDMNDWLGARFLKEMESIDTMSEVMRLAIEQGNPLKELIVLQQEDFLMESDYVVLKTPSPLPVPDTGGEEALPDHFTVVQLFKLFKQFSAMAPSGIISCKSFNELLGKMVSVTHGMEHLPEKWLQVTPAQIQELSSSLALDTEFLDWRRFLLALLWPIPTPTQVQLLETLQRFKEMDQKEIGFVSREQFDRTDMWFETVSPYHDSFDRLTAVKKIVFDIFADHTGSISKLDYSSMLLYFSAMPNYYEGFLRALSVAAGSHIPHLPKPVLSPAVLDVPQDGSVTDSTIPEAPEEEENKEVPDPPMSGEKIPAEALDSTVYVDTLYRVLHHSELSSGNSNRFSVSVNPEDKTSKMALSGVYTELASDALTPLPFKALIDHPVIQQVVLGCKTFKALDVTPLITASSTNSSTPVVV